MDELKVYTVNEINQFIHYQLIGKRGEVSDGSHTFDELYYHRALLFARIVKDHKDKAWKSKKHADELNFPMYPGYFVVGITTPKGDFSYHYSIGLWDKFDCKEIPNAPKFDGHTPDDIVRLLSL